MSKLLCLLLPAAMFGQGMGMPGRMTGRLPDQIASGANPLTPAKIDLGRMLFYDSRFSLNNDVSCNSCHDLDKYGVDGKPLSTGHNQQLGRRNSPSVYHAAGHVAQFWDGRATDVEEQAKGPVLNPVEMAMPSPNEVVARIRSIAGYAQWFHAAFPGEADPINFDNFARAIGAFERKLITPSRWDQFLAGDRGSLTRDEMSGHHEFMHQGCATCHNGPYTGGRQFEKLGLKKPWPVESDLGRFEVTKSAADRMVFKVPSLRNVERTAPYFHNGEVARLEDAVRLMGEHQLNTQLTGAQVRDIAAWLRTLTGEIPREYIRMPQLPR